MKQYNVGWFAGAGLVVGSVLAVAFEATPEQFEEMQEAPAAAPAVSATLTTAAAVPPSPLDAFAGFAPAREVLETMGRDDDVSKIVTPYLIHTRFADRLPRSREVQEAFVDWVRRHPDEGLHVLREGLARLPDSQAIERGALLSAALALPDPKHPRAMALEQMTRHAPPARPDAETAQTDDELNDALSTTWEMAVAVTAFEVFARSTREPRELLDGTLDAISAQRDVEVQRNLVSHFLKHAPDQRQALADGLSRLQLTGMVPQ